MVGQVDNTQRVYDYALNENGTPAHPRRGDVGLQAGRDHGGKAVDAINRRPDRPAVLPQRQRTAPTAAATRARTLPPTATEPRSRRCATRSRSTVEALPQPPSFNEADVSDKPPDIQNGTRSPPTAQQPHAAVLLPTRVDPLIDEAWARSSTRLRARSATRRSSTCPRQRVLQRRAPRAERQDAPLEPSSRVLLVMRGRGARGKTVRELAVNADLAKTVLDATGTSPGLNLDGRSLLTLAEEPKREFGREILIETATYTGSATPASSTSSTPAAQRRRGRALRPREGSLRAPEPARQPSVRLAARAARRPARGVARLRRRRLPHEAEAEAQGEEKGGCAPRRARLDQGPGRAAAR